MAYRPQFCINIECRYSKNPGGKFHKKGYFKIKRVNQVVRRYQCCECKRTLSSRSFKPDFRHKKMDLNPLLADLLVKGTTLRDCARHLGLTYRNTYNKFLWLIAQAKCKRGQLKYAAKELQFDEMETIHHTKCKPLSICLVVNEEYQVLQAQVAEMPAKGKLAEFSLKRYGKRNDEREKVMDETFQDVHGKLMESPMVIKSDAKASYRNHVEKYFPEVQYEVHSRVQKERLRERLHEKKNKRQFDPIFALNQRCAKLRSQIKRLTRRSWCTTKKVENLQGHLDIFIVMQFGNCF